MSQAMHFWVVPANAIASNSTIDNYTNKKKKKKDPDPNSLSVEIGCTDRERPMGGRGTRGERERGGQIEIWQMRRTNGRVVVVGNCGGELVIIIKKWSGQWPFTSGNHFVHS